jgi:outer membrane autotransporter protein
MGRSGGPSAWLKNVDVSVSGSDTAGVQMRTNRPAVEEGTKTITIEGGSIYSANGPAFKIGDSGPVTETDPQAAATAAAGKYAVAIIGGAVVGGASAFEIGTTVTGTLGNGSPYSAEANTALNLRVAGGSIINGGVNASGLATVSAEMEGGSLLNGDITAGGSSTVTVSLNDSTLTGKTAVSANATLAATFAGNAAWRMTGDSTLTHLALTGEARVHFPAPAAGGGGGGGGGGDGGGGGGGGVFHTLTVTGSLGGAGAFAMHTDIAAGVADRLVIQGSAAGTHQIALIPAAGAAAPTGGEAPLLLIQAAGGDATFATFTGTLDAGLYNYNLQDCAHLAAANSGLTTADAANWYLARSALSSTGDAIINTAAMLGRDWHYALDALHQRLGDVRADSAAAPVGRDLASRREHPAASARPLANRGATQGRALQGNVWTRARAYRLNADSTLTGRAFTQYAYGLTAGADKILRPAAVGTGSGATLLAGAFLDMGRTDRDFSATAANTGHTDNLSVGLYGTWLHDTGWHADLVLKADRYKHRFDARTAGADARPVTGAYNSDAQGFSLELGRRIGRADGSGGTDGGGWWIEPTAQAAVVWLHGTSYRTSPGNQSLDVKVGAARAAQYRAQMRFGRQLRDTRWHPYGKFGVVKTDTAGGEIRITGAGEPFAPDYDGWRGEFGLGASYLLDAHSQLYFDYEYGKAAHYERPWSLHLGYRVLW